MIGLLIVLMMVGVAAPLGYIIGEMFGGLQGRKKANSHQRIHPGLVGRNCVDCEWQRQYFGIKCTVCKQKFDWQPREVVAKHFKKCEGK